MAIKIFVRSKSETVKWLYNPNLPKLDWAVTMLDPGEGMPVLTGNPATHLRMGFLDVDKDTDHFAPTLNDCKALLDFCDRIKDDTQGIIHCYAGMSRSTCTALAFMVYKNNMPLDNVYEWIMAERPIAIPNPLMAKYYDGLIGMDGKFIEMCTKVANTTRTRMIIQARAWK